ncbi:tRNA lysidine(34) synthetase TilS [Desmospora profundinema]|uniref:tRNA(Ile)-lysidine synthase n=1 Tax=Desmospora profundinema TaxID=1571184 RepID=A0ABU1IQV6_9BACL|nr:tRNA lysidine(34) synthetase TilS [Desmospora profundinema]MDR6227091.1 tRNA(Ile)-lysidine synthase [Desmospora profundinema]
MFLYRREGGGMLEEKRVCEWEDRLLPRGSRVMVGVSGGPDSMALLHRLWSLAPERDWALIAVHVNHGLRGEESAEDARFVQSWCGKQSIACRVEQVDVSGTLDDHGGNKQDVARRLRYEAFRRVAEAEEMDHLALAHHGDDQVETLLMRLLRGTGTQGLSGIPRRRRWRGMWIVRPWLDVTREEILAYCDRHHISFRMDASNEDPAYTRNRVRHELAPLLARFNPRFRQALLQLSRLAADEEQVWERLTKEAFDEIRTGEDGKRITVDAVRLNGLEVALQRRVIKLILNCLVKESAIDANWQAVERIRELAAKDAPSTRTPLPGGGWAERDYHLLHFSPPAEGEKPPGDVFLPLKLPGETPWIGGSICAWFTSDRPPAPGPDQEWAVFDRDRLPSPLAIRTRRPGDRMRPFGLGGSKKVKALLIDAKIPRRDRDRIPLITAGEEILWIPGVARSDVATWDDCTRGYLVLRWVPDEGGAQPFGQPSDT